MIKRLKKLLNSMLKEVSKKQKEMQDVPKDELDKVNETETFKQKVAAHNQDPLVLSAKEEMKKWEAKGFEDPHEGARMLQADLINKGASPGEIVKLLAGIEALQKRLPPDRVNALLESARIDTESLIDKQYHKGGPNKKVVDYNLETEAAMMDSAISIFRINSAPRLDEPEKLVWSDDLQFENKHKPKQSESEYTTESEDESNKFGL